jgi:hypothetical protein
MKSLYKVCGIRLPPPPTHTHTHTHVFPEMTSYLPTTITGLCELLAYGSCAAEQTFVILGSGDPTPLDGERRTFRHTIAILTSKVQSPNNNGFE